MTRKTGDVSTSKEDTSIAPKLLSKIHTPAKVTSMTTTLVKKNPALLYNQGMLTIELRTNIDKNWEACWPINSLRPLVLLDLLSYLLFIKKIEEKKLMPGSADEISKTTFGYKKEIDELSWSSFKDMDPQSMQRLFTKEMGITGLMKNYANANLMYSIFVKEPLLLTPTARLLANMVDIVKIMEAENEETRAAIFEYIINKVEIVAQNGQVYAPDNIVKLMVAMMQPSSEDIIGDPSAGNGSFLVNSAMYIANKNSAAFANFKNDAAANIYKGIECDLIQLRIGAMNMILHGIEDPRLEGLNVFSIGNLSLREQPTLILSNLFFESTEDKSGVKTPSLQTESRRPEIRFLNLIIKNLQRGGRAAVIIRENMLYDNGAENKVIRQQIIDDHKLEGVISLPGKTGSFFSNACILVFTNPESLTTDKVWFYKKEPGNKKVNTKDPTENMEDYDEVSDILSNWKNEKEESGVGRMDRSFYVQADEIRANNYNLSFYEYRKIVKEPQLHVPPNPPVIGEEIITGKMVDKPALKEILPSGEEPKIDLPSSRVKKRISLVLLSLVIIGGLIMSFYFMFFENKNAAPAPVTTKNIVAPPKINPPPPTVNKVIKKTPETSMLSQAQIKAILKDTTGILHFQNQPGNIAANIKDPKKALPKFKNVAILVNKVSEKAPAPVITAGNLNVRYTVSDTTFFHDQPDETTRRKSFLDPLNKNILTPLQDQNGFIFIVYTNHFGRTSKGWINKKDLKPLH